MFSFLFYLFSIVVLLQIGFYGVVFSRFSWATQKQKHQNNFPVSILISCRNEASNLRLNLPQLLLQDYTTFEIIVVDDASTDDTLSVLQLFEKQHDNLKIISIPNTEAYHGNKKNALEKAIDQAKYEHLLLTDADCVPTSKSWISSMTMQFSAQKQLVLGYGAYEKKSGLLNKLVRYETLLTAWQYFSLALVGKPYMGVGRNIAYTKTLFYQQNGFLNHKHIQSGDDDLFVKEAATAKNVALCWQQEAHTISKPKTTMVEWIRQKKRHITTATSYKPLHQFGLGLFYISQFLFYSLFLGLISNSYHSKYLLILVSLRFVVYYFSLVPAAKKLNENDLIKYAPFLELLLIVIQMRIFISNLLKKPTTW